MPDAVLYTPVLYAAGLPQQRHHTVSALPGRALMENRWHSNHRWCLLLPTKRHLASLTASATFGHPA